MSEVQNITLYGTWNSPYSQRVQIALEEAKAKYTYFEIDLQNKPEWFVTKVNAAGKEANLQVPALTYGGPQVAADAPSAESVKLAESIVLLEFVADIFPEARLLPTDPVLRAKARLFMDSADTKFFPPFRAFFFGNGSADDLLAAVEALQAQLPAAGYVVGEWSVADGAVIPYLAMMEAGLMYEVGTFAEGVGKKTLGILRSPMFARLQTYLDDNKARLSFQTTWPGGDAIVAKWKSKLNGKQ
ncbi:Glutathione S-transferase U23 [Grifola frondosa]|uniref:Glutathione S-transferase U23 n=1 Tax=Grifola frondosa TaxID=5627 RepID=A0A1C7MN28_GRIFR|nr:Glutathione S-transferase U23 [Grifola frondosa]